MSESLIMTPEPALLPMIAVGWALIRFVTHLPPRAPMAQCGRAGGGRSAYGCRQSLQSGLAPARRTAGMTRRVPGAHPSWAGCSTMRASLSPAPECGFTAATVAGSAGTQSSRRRRPRLTVPSASTRRWNVCQIPEHAVCRRTFSWPTTPARPWAGEPFQSRRPQSPPT